MPSPFPRSIRRAAVAATAACSFLAGSGSRGAQAQPASPPAQVAQPASTSTSTSTQASPPNDAGAGSIQPGGDPVEVTVRGSKPASSIGAEDFRARDTRAVPGTFGDAFQSIAALPGVSPMASGLPYFYVRGAPPADTGYFIDGVPVPTLFHIGPGASVIPQALVNRVDFYPGAGPARYGRFVGGLITAETTAPTFGPGEAHGEGSVRLFDASAFVESPIGDSADVVVAGRYGYPNLLLSIFAPNLSLHFGDYTFRWTEKLSDVDRITLFALGAYDHEEDSTQNLVPIDSQFHRVDLRYDHAWSGGSLRVGATFGYDRTAGNIPESAAEAVQSTSARVRFEIRQRFGSTADLSAGADANAIHYQFGYAEAHAQTSPVGDEEVTGAYADVALHLMPGVDLVPGIRVDDYRPSSGLAGTSAAAADPKLSARAALSPGISWIATMGLAHQEASYVLPIPGLRVTSDAGLQKVYSVTQGVELGFPGDVKAKVTGFLNADRDVSDFVASCGALLNCSSVSSVDGTTYGLEVLVERALTHRLGGWISYTLSRAPREVDGVAYLSPFDRTHVLSIVAHYDLGAGVGAGLRGTYYSGRPDFPTYPPAGASAVVPAGPGVLAQYRLPAYYRIDARLDKRWDLGERGGSRRPWVTAVAEFFDATLTKEAVDYQCNNVRRVCVPGEIGPIALPSIGLEGGF